MAHDRPPALQGHAHVGHVVPLRLLFMVWGALVVLTIVTVAVTYIPAELLGPFTLWVALFIAGIKAALVALYFMHLRWDSPFNAICLIAALFFVCIFIGIAVLDSREYKVNYNPPGGGQIMNTQHAH